MINSISMTNFRKHRSAKFDFEPGLTTLRGANEIGKSSAIESIAYALFGVGALRTPLDKAVTWGEPVNSLKVELELTVDNVTYTVKRGKSGAECSYKDQLVTGQKEVTAFMGRALRMDVGAAQRLVLSNQKEIAGALEAGTKATTELIERLAEFHQIDRLLELMQEKLTIGSSATAEAALASAQTRLDEARAMQEPDMLGLTTDVDLRFGEVGIATDKLAQAQTVSDAASAAYAKVVAVTSEHADLDQREARLQRRYEAAMTQMDELKRAPVEDVPDADDQIQELLAKKSDLSKQAEVNAAYGELKNFLGRTSAQFYSGSQAELDDEVDEHQKIVDGGRASIAKAHIQIATLTGRLNSGSCGFCGQDFSAVPEVIAKNESLQVSIDKLRAECNTKAELVAGAVAKIEALNTIKIGAKPYVRLAQKYAQYLEIDDSLFPPTLGWNGGVQVKGSEDLTADDIDKLVRQIRTRVTNNAAWLQSLKDNATLLDALDPERQSILGRRNELGPLVPADQLEWAAQEAAGVLSTARKARDFAVTALNDAKGHLRDAHRDWERTLAERTKLEKLVDENREGIKTLEFNNALLKRVRAARPVIADRLWNLVLTSVSSYFSEMRGVASTVSKGPDGFLVDGEPVESFSGSTIDVLGLAIRVALVRTFLPAAPFLILDEPAAACSAERTDNMLGFIVGSGFKQVLLVTHEDVSENIADNIITLGETV